MTLGPHTVTLLRAPVVENAYGSETRDWGNAARTDVDGCSVQPAGAAEYNIDREAVREAIAVWMPLDADVLSTDRVEWKSRVFDISERQEWDFEPLGHITIVATRTEG